MLADSKPGEMSPDSLVTWPPPFPPPGFFFCLARTLFMYKRVMMNTIYALCTTMCQLHVVQECGVIIPSPSPSQGMTHKGSLTPTWRLLPSSVRHRGQWDQMLQTYFSNLCLMRPTSTSSVTSQPRTSVRQWGCARYSLCTCTLVMHARMRSFSVFLACTQFSGSVSVFIKKMYPLICCRHGMIWLWMVSCGLICTGGGGLLALLWKPN